MICRNYIKEQLDIGYTVANKETQLLGKYRHALRKLIRLDIAFLHDGLSSLEEMKNDRYQ